MPFVCHEALLLGFIVGKSACILLVSNDSQCWAEWARQDGHTGECHCGAELDRVELAPTCTPQVGLKKHQKS